MRADEIDEQLASQEPLGKVIDFLQDEIERRASLDQPPSRPSEPQADLHNSPLELAALGRAGGLPSAGEELSPGVKAVESPPQIRYKVLLTSQGSVTCLRIGVEPIPAAIFTSCPLTTLLTFSPGLS
jgi:hypothetical protein